MPDHPILTIKELEKFPCHTDRFLSSGRWKQMKDFQRGWYFELLLLMNRSKPLGYLPMDGRLWTLAGAHTKQFFDENSSAVLACFKVVEFDGLRWIYNETLMEVLCSSTYRHDHAVENGRKGGRSSKVPSKGQYKYSLEFETTWKNNTWKCVAKPQANSAFERALQHIQQEKKCARDEAIAFLADAMEEFKLSPAGRAHGMFDGYSPPYPASWLNAQRYFDDRGTWRPGRANMAGGARGANGTAAHTGSLAEKGCKVCGGSGWDMSSGKAARCACFERNRNANAAGAAKT